MATFKQRPLVCPAHPDTVHKVLLWDYDPVPTCPTCGGPMEDGRGRPNKATAVIGDECDITVEHGACHPDGTPRRFTSKSEMKRVAAQLGWKNEVRHMPRPGSDKSPHTTKWY